MGLSVRRDETRQGREGRVPASAGSEVAKKFSFSRPSFVHTYNHSFVHTYNHSLHLST